MLKTLPWALVGARIRTRGAGAGAPRREDRRAAGDGRGIAMIVYGDVIDLIRACALVALPPLRVPAVAALLIPVAACS
jgi:hypothetical protein